MTSIRAKLPPFHSGQMEVAQSPARFRVAACGRRRWGKTRLGAALCVKTAADGGRAWWVAPSYPVSMVGWRLLRRLASQVPGAEVRQSERLVSFPNGGEIQVRSADNPDSLRGEGLDFVVFDECAFIHEDAWQEAVRPALSDRLGRALFISTPKGRNWFWRLWQRCIDDHDHEWHGWQLPTAANPYIAPAEIEAARLGLPERIFSQEFLAQFLDDAGGVFRRVMDAATATALEKPISGAAYVAGVDVADATDFTAISILDTRARSQVYLDRFNRVGYEALEDRIYAAYKCWNVQTMIIEDNSIGQPVIDHLRRRGMNIVPFHTSAASKAPLIQALQSAFEHGEIRILNDPIQIGELQAYEGKRMASGMAYSAPSGVHDDTVMALALAWHGIGKARPLPTQPETPSRWKV